MTIKISWKTKFEIALELFENTYPHVTSEFWHRVKNDRHLDNDWHFMCNGEAPDFKFNKFYDLLLDVASESILYEKIVQLEYDVAHTVLHIEEFQFSLLEPEEQEKQQIFWDNADRQQDLQDLFDLYYNEI